MRGAEKKGGTSGGRPGSPRSAPKATPALDEYERKRDFSLTPEPAGGGALRPSRQREAGIKNSRTTGRFVVQEHHARRLHYDFRLELDGTLKSWAVPKGPSLDPRTRRLAVHVEDHPLGYAGFEGRIPAGQYGAGEVKIWDRGRWECVDPDASAAYRAGKLKFRLAGEKLSGAWTLVRTRLSGGGKENWLLIKEDDAAARREGGGTETDAQDDAPPARQRAEQAGKKGKSAGRPLAPATLDGALPAPLPDRLQPQLATLVREPPSGDAGEWRYELKFDGYRLLARIDAGRARLLTRSGLDWSGRLPGLAVALGRLAAKTAWLDGEIVVLDARGRPDFQALQNAFETGRGESIVYYLFDLMHLDGFDLRRSPLEQRRALLCLLLERAPDDTVRFSEDFAVAGDDVLRSACRLELEGVIGKRAGSLYVSRRSADWIKLKCRQRQEFVIGGFTPPQGRRSGFGALLLGVHDAQGALRYAGRVGTGFAEANLETLLAAMLPLVRPHPPFADPPTGFEARGVSWLAPQLVGEVEFAAWTQEGRVRHATFRGLRGDKPAREVARERPAPVSVESAAGRHADRNAEAGMMAETMARKKQDKAAGSSAGLRISHPERVIDARTGCTKLELAAFYRDIAPWLLPHLDRRPTAILRAPDGVAGEQFFQRHPGTLSIPEIRLIHHGDETLMEVDTPEALIGTVQMGTVEFHVWNADTAHLERPDRMIFDLDPDPSLPWVRVIEATRLLLTLLDELALAAFLKTSGGKGMHVVVPLARRHDWTRVKAFGKAVAEHLARHLPDRFAARMGPRNRVGKVFVDYLRNQKGGTTVAAYSVRARPGLGVSVPIAREELDSLTGSDQWSVRTLRQRLDALAADPWSGYANGQRITRAMQARVGMTGERDFQ